jgi:hypothetical protein
MPSATQHKYEVGTFSKERKDWEGLGEPGREGLEEWSNGNYLHEWAGRRERTSTA